MINTTRQRMCRRVGDVYSGNLKENWKGEDELKHDTKDNTLETIELILQAVSDTPTSANNLKRIINDANPKRRISVPTIQRYLDIIALIQKHPVRIRLTKYKVGRRTFRTVEKDDQGE